MKRRVVVTGLGAVTPLGIGEEIFWEALIQGKSGVGEVTLFDASDYPTRIGAEVLDFNPLDYLDSKQVRRMDRFTQFAMAATQLALDDAHLEINSTKADRVGVIVGSGIGGLKTLEEQHKVLLKKGPGRVSPFLIPMMICNLASGQVSIHFGAKGFNSCTVTACASANHAIGEAYEVIKEGKAEVMIAGGAEAAITPLSFAGFCSMKALSTRNKEPSKASRPFDALRDGFVMGEGAGILILEELKEAQDRGVHIYCEVVGYGATGDAYHITAPDPEAEGAAKAITMTLAEGGISPEEVDYINAHGTSTPYNDEFETLAIKKSLGERAYQIAVSSTKSMTGHLLGAAGGIEAIATALAIENELLPPTINYENPDPECDLDYVPNKARKRKIKVALSNSLGFGGHNAVLAFRKFKNNRK